jgi:uncharacterized membrane protein YfcA
MALIITVAVIFVLAVVMTMAGRGGGNFYVLVQIVAGVSMHQAATTGQFLMFVTSLAALLIFQKQKHVAWPMAVFIGLTTSVMAFVGGFVAHDFSGPTLKCVFGGMLTLAGLLMLFPAREPTGPVPVGWGYWRFSSGTNHYVVNLWLAVPIALATGLVAGMVGVSGGSFLLPLMVLACRLPMRLAVGTASVMVAATALMGFLGHLSQGAFNPRWVLPQAAAAVVGGIIAGKLTFKTKPKHLKQIFALTTLAAAVFVLITVLRGP